MDNMTFPRENAICDPGKNYKILRRHSNTEYVNKISECAKLGWILRVAKHICEIRNFYDILIKFFSLYLNP